MILIAALDVSRAESMVRNARPGESFVYHVGNLSADRVTPDRFHTPFEAVARRMLHLYERGFVDLVQRKIDADVYEYIAIRKREPRPRFS